MTPDEMQGLVALTASLGRAVTLEEMLAAVVDCAADLLRCDRVSIRLLDESGHRLLVGARAGAPLHDSVLEFSLGEGLVGWTALHGRPLRVDDGERDPRFVARPGMSGPMGAFLGLPLLDASTCIGVLSAIRPEPFDDGDERLLTLLAGMAVPHLRIARLRRLAQVDPLTGALNRRGFEEAFPDHLFVDATPLSVVMADVDHFKRINDAHGHAAGDRVLQVIATKLGAVIRRGDALVRMGGEEFLLVLPGAELRAASHVAERARSAVAAALIAVEGPTLAVTISLGVAERRGAERREDLVARADAALYAAKEHGRDRVELAT